MRTIICYNCFNRPVSTTDANGIVTKYTCNDAGLVTRVERLDGSEALSSLSVAYDGSGRPVSYADQDGLVKSFERYAYDKAGNMLRKTVNGKTTTFTFDAANQLVSSTTDGVTTRYGYDAAGRMVREGNKCFTYGYLDKVMSVTDGETTRAFTYHADGQLARATCAGTNRTSEDFRWDGLALVRRGDEQFVNEPHVGGGNPVASSKGVSYFNDALGTTVGSKSNGKYSAAALTAFGERLDSADGTSPAIRSLGEGWFTGKPYVEGLGHAFLMRNYRASLAKWQTADPMGYPDGWNQLAYCNNGVTSAVDLWGCATSKANMYEVDPDRIKADNKELGEKMVELNAQGWTIDAPRYIWTMLYYCNEEWKHSKHYEEPLSPLEQELTGCTKAVVDEYEDWADIYRPYRCTASMQKSEVLDLSEDAILTLVGTVVGIWSPIGGAVIGITVAGFRDAIRAIDGNTVTMIVGDGWTFNGRQCIDTRVEVALVE